MTDHFNSVDPPVLQTKPTVNNPYAVITVDDYPVECRVTLLEEPIW